MRWVTRERPKIDRLACELGHDGPYCSFGAFLPKHRLEDPALAALANIVRAADTDTLERSPQAASLLAISLGLGERHGWHRGQWPAMQPPT